MNINLPRVASSRGAADSLVADAPDQLHGIVVTLNCRDLFSGTRSFADQLVQRLLIERGAEQLVLLRPPAALADHFREATSAHGVGGRLQIIDEGSADQ